MTRFKRTLACLLAAILLFGAIPFAAQAATSSDVAAKISANLPIVTYAMP